MTSKFFLSEAKDLFTDVALLTLVDIAYEGIAYVFGFSDWSDSGLGSFVRIALCCFIALPIADRINWRRKQREKSREPKIREINNEK